MGRFLSWLIAIPVGLLGLVFALSNKDDVSLKFWPFDLQLGLPLSILVLGLLLIGVSVGLMVGWVNSLAVRIELRHLRKAFLKLQEETRIIPPTAAPSTLTASSTIRQPASSVLSVRPAFLNKVRPLFQNKPKF